MCRSRRTSPKAPPAQISIFAKFLGYATGSLYEAVTQAFIAQRPQFLAQKQFQRIYSDAEEISRMLTGLRDSLHR